MKSEQKPALAVIGGSGLYNMKGVKIVEERRVETPFGEPSDAITVAELDSVRLLFLPRHGKDHRILPSEINYRANLCGLKMMGATRVVSVSAVGSMKENIHPGEIVIVDQFFDRTWGRPNTFFGDGVVGHVPFGDPVCGDMADTLHHAAKDLGIPVHKGGTYICIQGPTFSSRAESRIFRTWNVDVIGMTNLPEARLAREAELCYATLALVTDYDCWRSGEEDVSIDAILGIIGKNVSNAQEIIRRSAEKLMKGAVCKCMRALDHVIVTDKSKINEEARARLLPIAGRVL